MSMNASVGVGVKSGGTDDGGTDDGTDDGAGVEMRGGSGMESGMKSRSGDESRSNGGKESLIRDEAKAVSGAAAAAAIRVRAMWQLAAFLEIVDVCTYPHKRIRYMPESVSSISVASCVRFGSCLIYFLNSARDIYGFCLIFLFYFHLSVFFGLFFTVWGSEEVQYCFNVYKG